MLCKTVPYLNVYLPCCSDTLQVPAIYAVENTSSHHKGNTASVVIPHIFRLVNDCGEPYVEARLNKVR